MKMKAHLNSVLVRKPLRPLSYLSKTLFRLKADCAEIDASDSINNY